MSRALLTLAVGILLTFTAVMLLTPGALIAPDGFMFVLLTILAGTAVMTVVVRRARIRERAEQLERAENPPTDDPTDPIRVTEEDSHRG